MLLVDPRTDLQLRRHTDLWQTSRLVDVLSEAAFAAKFAISHLERTVCQSHHLLNRDET